MKTLKGTVEFFSSDGQQIEVPHKGVIGESKVTEVTDVIGAGVNPAQCSASYTIITDAGFYIRISAVGQWGINHLHRGRPAIGTLVKDLIF